MILAEFLKQPIHYSVNNNSNNYCWHFNNINIQNLIIIEQGPQTNLQTVRAL